MPQRAQRPCNQPGCPKLATANGRCEQHQAVTANWDRERKRDAIALLYGTARWQATRAIVLIRDLLCKNCGIRRSTDCDHVERARLIVQKYGVDGFFDPARCQGLCHKCHSIKTSTEVR